MTDDVPDLEELDQGDEVTVYYRSQRSGSEVDREGVVTEAFDSDGGQRIVSVHVEERSPFKRQYVRLIDAETEAGDEVVAAYSVTAEADHDLDDPPKIGPTYTLTFDVERVSLLGVVDRIVVDVGPIALDYTVLGGSA